MRPSGAAHELGTSLSWSRCGPVLVRAASVISGPNSLRTSYGRSSTGRASVSKTEGCRFDSCRPCRPRPTASGCSLRTPQRTMRDRVEHRTTEGPSARPRRTRRPARCQRETQDAARRERPVAADGGGSARCGVSACIPALGAGGRGSTPCISTLAPSSSMVERTPDTRTVGGSSPPSATHPHARDDPRR